MMLNTYPQFETLDQAEDHVQYNCTGPCLCVVGGTLWDVRGGGYSYPASVDDISTWESFTSLHKGE